jgi:hypothetical protein
MSPSRPKIQHLLPELMPRRQCPSCTRHQFVPSIYSGHVITYSRMLPLPSAKQPFCRMMACSRPQASLPNALRKISYRMVFSYQTRPTSQSLSCTNLWCLHMALQLRDKSVFIPGLTINAQRLQDESVQHTFFPPSNHSVLLSRISSQIFPLTLSCF